MNIFSEMSAKKKKSLDKKLKARMAKYEDELEEYLNALDDAKRCKYDEVSLTESFLSNNVSNLAQNGKE